MNLSEELKQLNFLNGVSIEYISELYNPGNDKRYYPLDIGSPMRNIEQGVLTRDKVIALSREGKE